jgi:hypothetical protein
VRRGLLIAAVVGVVAVAASSAAAGTPSCRTAEIRQHDEAVFGHFATHTAARALAGKARRQGFQGIRLEDDGCGDVEVEIDGADTDAQRSSFAAEAAHAGFQVTFEQTGEPLEPPSGQVVGVFARKRTVAQANALAWKLAANNFRYIDIVPSGSAWLVVMPQVPVKHALSIAKEVASAGYRIQFRNGSSKDERPEVGSGRRLSIPRIRFGVRCKADDPGPGRGAPHPVEGFFTWKYAS